VSSFLISSCREPSAATKPSEATVADVSHDRRSGLRQIFRWFEHLLAAIGLCFVLYQVGFEMVTMTSGSMSPTLRGTSLENGDHVLVEKITRWFRSPRRWEVYFFYDDEGTPMAKRIIGLPGESICLKENHLFANGKEIRPPAKLQWLKYYAYGNLQNGREVDCGRGYFVLGDDTRDSYDSRYVGPIAPNRFRGRVWLVLWPPSRAGFVR
jgi:signal peptidase I